MKPADKKLAAEARLLAARLGRGWTPTRWSAGGVVVWPAAQRGRFVVACADGWYYGGVVNAIGHFLATPSVRRTKLREIVPALRRELAAEVVRTGMRLNELQAAEKSWKVKEENNDER